MLTNFYHDGSRQASLLGATSRKRWQLTQRLSATALATLLTFYQSKGTTAAFYFYDPFSPITGQPIGSNYDTTGVSTQGRYSVVFKSDWNESVGMALTGVNLEICEVA